MITHDSPQRFAVTILRPQGALNWLTYERLIAEAQEARPAGRRLVIDLSAVDHVSIAGLVALNMVARLQAGLPLPPAEAGWEAIHALAERPAQGRRLAVVVPQPGVKQAITRLPFSAGLAIYTSLDAALNGPYHGVARLIGASRAGKDQRMIKSA